MSDGKMIVSMRYHPVYRVHCAVSSVITRTVMTDTSPSTLP